MSISTSQLSQKGRAAVSMAEDGTWILPVVSDGKRPITDRGLGLEHGYKDARNDPAMVHAWWSKYPNANIGLVTGERNALAVCDLDWRGGADIESLPAQWRQTAIILTPGGAHLYYHHPGPQKSYAELDGIGIKADGGYVVAPPSVRPEGTYEVYKAVPMLELPTGLVERYTPEQVYKRLTDGQRAAVSEERSYRPIRVGNPRAWADKALSNQVRYVLRATERNNQLNVSAFVLAQIVAIGLLREETVYAALLDAAARRGLDESEARPTIASGMSRGRYFPRQIILT